MDKFIKNINKLISGIADGNKKSLQELYDLTARMCLAMAKKYLHDKSLADDVVSVAFVKIVRGADDFNRLGNGLNWIFKIVKNTALNQNRNNFNNDYSCEYGDKVLEGIIDCHDADEWIEQIVVRDAIAQLSEDERQIIYFRYWLGYDIKNIANHLNLPMTTAYDKIMRTLKKLEKYLR